MEIVIMIEMLKRRKIVLAVGILLSILAGAAGAGILPPHTPAKSPATGQALTTVVVDTRIPLVASVKPGGDATIVQRAVFLADLLQSTPMTERIAKEVGVPAWQVTVLGPVLPPTSEFTLYPDGQLPVVAAAASQSAVHTPYVIQLLPSYTVPIVQIGTVAPDAHSAVVLARATVAAMKAAVSPNTLVASAARVTTAARGAGERAAEPAQPPLSVDELGPVSSVAIPPNTVHGFTGVAASLSVLMFWCFGAVVARGLRRAWRRAARPAPRITV